MGIQSEHQLVFARISNFGKIFRHFSLSLRTVDNFVHVIHLTPLDLSSLQTS